MNITNEQKYPYGSSELEIQSRTSQIKDNVLKINLQRDINTYLSCSLPLCIILVNDNIFSWFYEHYIHIFSVLYTSEDNIAHIENIDFVESFSYRDIVEEIIIEYEAAKKIPTATDYIRQKINHGYHINNLCR